MSHENDRNTHVCIPLDIYILKTIFSGTGLPLKSGSFANPVENTDISLHFFSETIRRKVVHHFGADP